MMYFKPVDEQSTRHLFSSPVGVSIFKLAYVGPVISPSGRTESSPDALYQDQRVSTPVVKRVEFKYTATKADDFEKNGRFDIAVVFDCQASNRKKLESDLRAMHGCTELIVMADFKAFRDLPDYNTDAIARIGKAPKLETILERKTLEGIFNAHFAASVSPKEIGMAEFFENMVKLKLIPGVSDLPKGANSRPDVVQKHINSLIQCKLLIKTRRHWYRWNPAYDPKQAVLICAALISKSNRKVPQYNQ